MKTELVYLKKNILKVKVKLSKKDAVGK